MQMFLIQASFLSIGIESHSCLDQFLIVLVKEQFLKPRVKSNQNGIMVGRDYKDSCGGDNGHSKRGITILKYPNEQSIIWNLTFHNGISVAPLEEVMILTM